MFLKDKNKKLSDFEEQNQIQENIEKRKTKIEEQKNKKVFIPIFQWKKQS